MKPTQKNDMTVQTLSDKINNFAAISLVQIWKQGPFQADRSAD